MIVSIERQIKKISGNRYDGYLIIAGIRLDYRVKLTIPVTDIASIDLSGSLQEARENVEITVKKNFQNIDLSNNEYFLFFLILAPLVVVFHRENEKQVIDVDPSIKTSSVSYKDYEFPAQSITMLSETKFGCIFS